MRQIELAALVTLIAISSAGIGLLVGQALDTPPACKPIAGIASTNNGVIPDPLPDEAKIICRIAK